MGSPATATYVAEEVTTTNVTTTEETAETPTTEDAVDEDGGDSDEAEGDTSEGESDDSAESDEHWRVADAQAAGSEADLLDGSDEADAPEADD